MQHLPAVLLFVVLPCVLLWLARNAARRTQRRAALLRRAAWLPLTVLCVHGLSFLLIHAVPGGPFDDERPLPAETRAGLEARFGLDRPMLVQWAAGVSGMARGDFGPSLAHRDYSVSEVVITALPPSLLLGALALAWTLLLGIPAGVWAACRRGKAADHAVNAAIALLLALPTFVLAGLLMIPLVFQWRLLPAAGLHEPAAVLLPSLCLGLPLAAQVARLVRSGMLEALRGEWVRTLRAAGLPERRVAAGALRLAMVSVVAFLGQAAAAVLTGSLVIEQLFAIPGLGAHFVESALNRDFTLALGVVILYTALAYVLNWTADLLLPVVDPRAEVS